MAADDLSVQLIEPMRATLIRYATARAAVGATRERLEDVVAAMEAAAAKPPWDSTHAEHAAEVKSAAHELATISAELARKAEHAAE
jgi:hypothetical protein